MQHIGIAVEDAAMAIQLREYAVSLAPSPRDLWGHPTLDLFQNQPAPVQKARLYLAPSTFGESFDRGDEPQPTSASELPDIHRWIAIFSANILEIYAGRRQPAQIMQRVHRVIYMQILHSVGSLKSIAKIKSIYISTPLDGVCEASITIAVEDRVRAISMRCEGVDGRWLCTSLRML